MRYNAILINPYCKDDLGNFSSNTYLAAFQRAALEQAEVTNLHLLPKEQFRIEDAKDYRIRFVKEIQGAICTDALNVVGVTHYASEPGIAIELAKFAKFLIPQRVIVVGGGPFFSERRIDDEFSNPIKEVLNQRIEGRTQVYSAVGCGGFQSYLDILGIIKEGEFDLSRERFMPKKDIEGLYYMDKNGREVNGNGRARQPNMPYAPFILSRSRVGQRAVSMFSNVCENRCYFCNTGSQFRFSDEQVAEGLDRLQMPDEPSYFELHDPNPLSAANRKHTYECIELVNFKFGNVFKSFFIDSILFREPEQLWEDIQKLNIWQFFVGVDSISEQSNSIVGSCYRGKPKKQQDLTAELEGLEHVIRMANESGRPYFCQPSFILSPNETQETLEYALKSMKKLRDMGGERHSVEPIAFLLEPFPGTRLLEQQSDLLAKEPFFAHDDAERWDEHAISAKYPDSVFEKVTDVIRHLNRSKRDFEGALDCVKS